MSDVPIVIVADRAENGTAPWSSKLVSDGYTVVAVDRDKDRLDGLQGGVHREVADSSDPTVPAPLMKSVVKKVGPPIGLVNTLGTFVPGDALTTTSDTSSRPSGRSDCGDRAQQRLASSLAPCAGNDRDRPYPLRVLSWGSHLSAGNRGVHSSPHCGRALRSAGIRLEFSVGCFGGPHGIRTIELHAGTGVPGMAPRD
jgi:NAD(P)-dependent dehydrogenase (short-subunit alcohol dehydrogenase family)